MDKFHNPGFCNLLTAIETLDTAKEYERRNDSVISAVAYALELGLDAGFRVDVNEPEWPVAFIELPTGQVSWHVEQHSKPWDGHTTNEKYQRIKAFIEEDKKKEHFDYSFMSGREVNKV